MEGAKETDQFDIITDKNSKVIIQLNKVFDIDMNHQIDLINSKKRISNIKKSSQQDPYNPEDGSKHQNQQSLSKFSSSKNSSSLNYQDLPRFETIRKQSRLSQHNDSLIKNTINLVKHNNINQIGNGFEK